MTRESSLAWVVSVDLWKMRWFIKPATLWEEFEDGGLQELTEAHPR